MAPRCAHPASLVLGAFLAAATPEAAPPLLTPGAEVEGALGAGESHLYRLEPRTETAGLAGRMLLLSAEQHGRDIVLDLLGPGGETLASVDSPSGRHGGERLSFRAQEAGAYTLVVRSPAGGAGGSEEDGGRYVLKLEVLPETSALERRRIEAEELTTAADRAYAAGEKAASLVAYEEASGRWRGLGMPAEEARCLTHLGILRRLADDPRGALAALEEALALWHRQGRRRQQARVHNELGFNHQRLGAGERALAIYRRALELWRQLGDAGGEATTRNNLVLLHHQRGDPRTAREHYEAALRGFERSGDARRAALALVNLGGVADVLGEPEEALERYRQALEALRELDRPRDQAQVLGNVAVILRGIGRYQEAIDRYREALALQRRLGARADEARTLANLGTAYAALGRKTAAHALFEQALAVRRELGDRRGEAYTLHNLGDLLESQGSPVAGSVYERALALQRTLGDRRGEAQTLADLGALRAAEGRPAAAREQLEAALELARAVGDTRLEAKALQRLGALEVEGGRAEAGRARLLRALELARASRSRNDELGALIALARAERARGGLSEAEERAREAVALVEGLRAGVASPELRAALTAHRHQAYELSISFAMDRHRREPAAGHDRRALELAERSRARSLLELVQASGGELGSEVAPELAARRRQLVERVALKGRRREELAEREPHSEATRAMTWELEAALRELGEVDDAIRRRSPRWAALTRPEPLDASAVQDLLDGGTLLLYYALGETRSFLFALTAEGFESHELPPRATIEATARAPYADWRTHDVGGGDTQGRQAEALSEMLLGPLGEGLGERRLAVVADGALHYLPFAALPRPGSGEPLVERHEVVHLPSASVLALQRSLGTGRPAPEGTLAIVADPVFDPRDPRLGAPGASPDPSGEAPRGPKDFSAVFDRLPWSWEEAEAIARHAGEDERLVARGFDADLALVTGGGLRGYRVVHFATHGVIDAERPALSGLMLSGIDREGRSRPGFLGLPAVYALELRADLVVLSGCRTALGQELRGEGPWGLVQGFFHAGAARVVASLWQVEDRATAELMDRFYAALLGEGLPAAAALSKAQRSLRAERRWADPYHWAAFVVYGDWR